MANNRKRTIVRMMEGQAITILNRLAHLERIESAGYSVPNYSEKQADKDIKTLSSYASILERLYGEYPNYNYMPEWAVETLNYLE